MEGSTPAARRPNLQPLPDPEPEFVADLDDAPDEPPSRRLWVPGRSTAGQAIAAFRAERDSSPPGPGRPRLDHRRRFPD